MMSDKGLEIDGDVRKGNIAQASSRANNSKILISQEQLLFYTCVLKWFLSHLTLSTRWTFLAPLMTSCKLVLSRGSDQEKQRSCTQVLIKKPWFHQIQSKILNNSISNCEYTEKKRREET